MKPQQMMVASEFINQRDVFAVLLTGFGKTLFYLPSNRFVSQQ